MEMENRFDVLKSDLSEISYSIKEALEILKNKKIKIFLKKQKTKIISSQAKSLTYHIYFRAFFS